MKKIVFDGIVEEHQIPQFLVGSPEVHVPGKVNLEEIARTHSVEGVCESVTHFEDILLYEFVGKKVRITIQELEEEKDDRSFSDTLDGVYYG